MNKKTYFIFQVWNQCCQAWTIQNQGYIAKDAIEAESEEQAVRAYLDKHSDSLDLFEQHGALFQGASCCQVWEPGDRFANCGDFRIQSSLGDELIPAELSAIEKRGDLLDILNELQP